MKIEITMEQTKRVAMEFDVTEEQLENIKNGENPFFDEMKNEIENGNPDLEYDYSVCDEVGRTIVDWDQKGEMLCQT